MNIYLDCGSGVAGDMLLGALVELGLSSTDLERTLQRVVRFPGWSLSVTKTERQQWPARAVRVIGDRPFGSSTKMKKAIRRSALPLPVKERALRILTSMEWAEARAHGGKGDAFEPHGLGLLDTMIDVVGVSYGLWKLGIDKIESSHLNSGRLAPATVHLIRRYKIPTYGNSFQFELATPTGVAILGEIAKCFGPMPVQSIEQAGYGAGGRDHPGRPNVLAIYKGKAVSSIKKWTIEQVVELQTVIDDMDPRLYPHVSELLFQAGALDVWWISAGMKKGRPGTAFHALARPSQEAELLDILFRETTTLGVRRFPLERYVLPRHHEGVRKVARLPDGHRKAQPEYEWVRRKALQRAIPLQKLLK
jgi:pyridinium-3,5-bisthiocarboxylic acid mononucleotide nickel chelatase